jgi:arylsulfatase A-like enzyme
VVARLDDAAAASSSPVPRIRHRRLDNASRPALAILPGTAFETTLAASGGLLVFSFGLDVVGGDPSSAVDFAIDLERQDGWQTIFQERVASSAVGWHDRFVELEALERPGFHLRFRTDVGAWAAPGNSRALWGGVSILGVPADEAGDPEGRPSILLISLDTLGADYLGSFAGEADASPDIDAFLGESFSFRRAYAQYGSTFPSQSSLFSALYPIHHGRYKRARPALESLVSRLAGAGYFTAAFTENAWVGSAFGFARGFDWYDDGVSKGPLAFSNRHGEDTFRRAGDWLERHGRTTRFFLFVHTYEVHAPYTPEAGAPRALADRLTPNDDRVFDHKEMVASIIRHNRGGEIRGLDALVGDLLERIDRIGLADDTIVVLTSDHGDQFGEHGKLGHGASLHNRILHVPLAFRWPGRIPAGESREPVQLVDVLPTLLELAGMEVPEAIDGRSLAASFAGRGPSARAAFSELRLDTNECVRFGGGPSCTHARYAVQTGRFKYVRSELPAYEQLHDLEADPLESRDVGARHPEELARHRRLLEEYLATTGDRVDGPTADDRDATDDITRERLRALGAQPSSRFAYFTTRVFTPARSKFTLSFWEGPLPATERMTPTPKCGWRTRRPGATPTASPGSVWA